MNERDRLSERIERAALVSLHDNCPAAAREALGLFLVEVADGIVVGATRDPSILLNRTLGLGTERPLTTETLRAVQEVYEARGVGRYFLHVYPASLAQGDKTLEGTGLERARGWMKFSRGREPAIDAPTNLRVEQIGEDGAREAGRIAARAFGMTDAAGALFEGLARDPRWSVFATYDGEQTAGTGALFVDGDAAWLEWGATDPAFRQRGSQGAIMSARVERALALGAQTMFTETGEEVPGDRQHSYRNIQRHGFEESVLRENWAPPKR